MVLMSPIAIPASTDGTSASDDLSGRYTEIANAKNVGEKNREAAFAFIVAEQHLNEDENHVEALRHAAQAVKLFRESGDEHSATDALRLSLHAQRLKAQAQVYVENKAEEDVKKTIAALEQMANEEMEKFRIAGDKRGEAAMLLSLAEAHALSRAGSKKHQLAKQSVRAAIDLFREVADRKMEGNALNVLCCMQTRRSPGAVEAEENASKALTIFRDLDDQKGEAKALHMQALTQCLRQRGPDGVQAMQEVQKIYVTLGMKKQVAFELMTISEWATMCGNLELGLESASKSLSMFQELPYGVGWKARALDILTDTYLAMGRVDDAVQVTNDMINEFTSSGAKKDKADALETLAKIYAERKDNGKAVKAAEDAVQASHGDLRAHANMLRASAWEHMNAKDWEYTASAAQEATIICQQLGDVRGEAIALHAIIRTEMEKGNITEAIDLSEQQRDLFVQVDDKGGEGAALIAIVGCYMMVEQYEVAMDRAHEAVELFREADNKTCEGHVRRMIGEIHGKMHDYEGAVESFREAMQLYEEEGTWLNQAGLMRPVAELHLENGHYQEALRAAQDGMVLVRENKTKRHDGLLCDMALLVSQVSLAVLMKQAEKSKDPKRLLERDGPRALRPAQEAVSVARKNGDKSSLAAGLRVMAEAMLKTSRLSGCLTASQEARKIFQGLGDIAGECAVVLLLAEANLAQGGRAKAVEIGLEGLDIAKNAGLDEIEQRTYNFLKELGAVGQPALQAVPQFQFQPQIQQVALQPMPAMPEQPAAESAAIVAKEPEKKGLSLQYVTNLVQNITANIIDADDDISLDAPLMDSGLDSLSAINFRNTLQKDLNVKLPGTLMFDYPTMRGVAEHLVEVTNE